MITQIALALFAVGSLFSNRIDLALCAILVLDPIFQMGSTTRTLFSLNAKLRVACAVLGLIAVILSCPVVALICYALTAAIYFLPFDLRDYIAAQPSQREFVERALAIPTPDAPWTLPIALQKLGLAGQWQQALQLHQSSAWSSGNEHQKIFWLASIQLGLGNYQSVIELAAGKDIEKHRLEVSVALARAHLGDRRGALDLARQAVARKRDAAELALGDIYALDGANRQALLWYERGMARWGSTASLWRRAAAALEAIGDLEEASAMWECSIRQSPFFAWTDLIQLVDCRRRLGRNDMQHLIDFAQRVHSSG